MTERKQAPVASADWLDPDVYALQAMERGEATPDQQKRALYWIIHFACQTHSFCLTPESDRLSAIFDGRRFAGLQIIKLLKINMADMKDLRRRKAEQEKMNNTLTGRIKKHAG